jgi:hypothetical protein
MMADFGLSYCFTMVNRGFPIFGDFWGAGMGQNLAVYEKCMKIMSLFLLDKSEDLYGSMVKCTKIHTGACGCMNV